MNASVEGSATPKKTRSARLISATASRVNWPMLLIPEPTTTRRPGRKPTGGTEVVPTLFFGERSKSKREGVIAKGDDISVVESQRELYLYPSLVDQEIGVERWESRQVIEAYDWRVQ